MPKERRRTPRHQLGRVTAILCGPGEERSCLVKHFSDSGVRLQLDGFEIPDDFALVFAPNELAQSGRYKVVWRLGNDVGKTTFVQRHSLDTWPDFESAK